MSVLIDKRNWKSFRSLESKLVKTKDRGKT